MLINTNKRKRLHKKRVQFPLGCLGTPTWPPFYCFGTPIWPPWRHVNISRSHVKVFFFFWFIYFILRSRRVIFSWAFKSSEPCCWVWQACYTHHSSAQTGNLSSLSQNSFLVWWPGEVEVMSRKNLVRGFSKIQLVVYYQCCVLIGWATSRLYVIAH